MKFNRNPAYPTLSGILAKAEAWNKDVYSLINRRLRFLVKEALNTGTSDLLVRHDPAEGTTISGDTRTWKEQIKALRYPRFQWSPTRTAYYVVGSADKDRPAGNLDTIADALREKGAKVHVEIGEGERRSYEEQIKSKLERSEQRSQRYEQRSGKALRASNLLWKQQHSLASRHTGEPIKVGHHSERRHRRDIQRLDTLMRKSIAEEDRAAYWSSRSAGAEARARQIQDPGVVIRRIERLEADQRVLARRGADTSEIDEQIAYWKGWLAKNSKRPYGPGDFEPGEVIRGNAVLRVGEKSITLAVRKDYYNSRPAATETYLYTDMGSTTDPEKPPYTPEEKGKHPRAKLIEAIYRHPSTPEPWRVRIGWKHGLAHEPNGEGKGTRLWILEDLSDAELDQIATERGIPTTGEIVKEKKHPYLALIKEIYTARGAGYRKKIENKHTISLGAGGGWAALEDASPEVLARYAFQFDIDPSKYGLSTGWTITKQLLTFGSFPSDKVMTIDGTPVTAKEAYNIHYFLKSYPGQKDEIRNWIDTHPVKKSLQLAKLGTSLSDIPGWYGWSESQRLNYLIQQVENG